MMQNFTQNNTGEKNLHTVKDRADTVLDGIWTISCLHFCFSWHSAFSLYSSPVCNRLTIMNNDVMVDQRARLFCFSWHSAFSLYSSPVCNRLTIMNNDAMVDQRARLFCFSWHSAFSLYSSPVCNRLTIMNNDVMVDQRARLFWKTK